MNAEHKANPSSGVNLMQGVEFNSMCFSYRDVPSLLLLNSVLPNDPLY